MRIGLVACVGLVLLGGCSDPKKASEDNFKKAIDAYLEKQPMCINAPTSSTRPVGLDKDRGGFPAYVETPTTPAGQQVFQLRAKQFDALVKAGLLSTRAGSIDVKDFWGTGSKKLPVKIYDLTDAGRTALTKPADGNPYGYKFCYGTAEVDEVTQFTEPSPAFGMTVSSVSYTYHVRDQASWAGDPVVQNAFPALKQATGDKLTGKTSVVLTNKGWVDGRGSRL